MTERSLFDETQEEFERQKWEKLWRDYSGFILAAAVIMVLATAGATAYRSWKTEHEQKLTLALLEAVQPGADTKARIAVMQKFAGDHPATNQADFALLRAGALAAEQNDKTKAAQIFDQVAANDKADPAFRQLGDLLSVQVQIDDGDPALLSQRLEPLTKEKSAWRYSALEDQAYLALKKNDKEKARHILTQLAQDARTPQSIAARASDLLRSLD